jgi:carboxypeptidase C (cathepsin A)
MKKYLGFPAVLLLFIILCMLCPAQQSQSQSTKPGAPRKQTTTPSSEKPPETTSKPEVATEQKPAIHEAPADKEKDKEEHYDMAEVPPVVTHHQITVDGKALKYTATAGRLPIKRGDGKIEAEMFYVAYTLDGDDASKRPLTFAFNGGRDRRRYGCTWVRSGRGKSS